VNHLTDDDLVLHYYGEDGPGAVAAEHHLRSCERCAQASVALKRTLDAIPAPELVDAPDDLPELRALLHDRSPSSAPSGGRSWAPPGEASTTALVWLTALAYPFSLHALFGSAALPPGHAAGAPLVALTLTWACAGPFVATVALNRMVTDGFERVSARLLMLGALMAAISPSAYLLVSRLDARASLNLGVWLWFAAVALGFVLALVRWPRLPSSGRFLLVHRLSAAVLTVYVLGHVVNQALAFVSLDAYAAMRRVMLVASQDPLLYTVIVGAVVIQIATGIAMGVKRVRAGAVARNLQAVTGWCLAAFLLVHVFGPVLLSPLPATASAPVNQFDLLASPRGTSQLPFLLIGVAAFLFHVGVYARLSALTYLADASVRRLSYAAMFVGTTVVVTVGLALCGIHLIR
jgi:succinate dehydrogenase/fumarate reductase cytochrome b subunit